MNGALIARLSLHLSHQTRCYTSWVGCECSRSYYHQAAEEAQATAQSDMHSKCMEVEALRNELLELSTLAEEQKKVLEEQHQSSDAAKKVIYAALPPRG